MSLDIGQAPSDWRDAWKVLVCKKGEKHKATNYRPVSLTSITCKLLEHIIYSNVMAHPEQHGILKNNQHIMAFTRNTRVRQLVVTIQEINTRLSKGNQVDIILLDFAKAFDRVQHSRLLYKMEHYWIWDQASVWIRAFL